MADTNKNRVQTYEIPDFTFQDGTTCSPAKVCYLDLNTNSSKTALVITCFRGRLQSTLNFADGALKDHRVIVVALFGNGESSSPSNTSTYPRSIEYEDCVRAQKELLTTHLGIPSLDVVVGFSMGGQCTYYWSLMYPDFLRNAVIICSSARTSRHNYQFLEGPKAALQNAVDYVDKTRAPPPPEPSRGVQAFGKAYSAWLTSAEWFDQEEYRSLGYNSLSAWDHDSTSARYAGWDADDLLAMLHMWQRGDVTKFSGLNEETLDTALSRIKARVLLMPCSSDQYFRPGPSEREAKWIPSASSKPIQSVWGHLAGSGSSPVDTKWMDEQITEFLEAEKKEMPHVADLKVS